MWIKLKELLSGRRLVRFIEVGFANAFISFGVLNLAFYRFGISKIGASIIATTCALIFSFFLNRQYVFADRSTAASRQVLPFILVTVSGSLLVLNGVYIASLHLLAGHEQLFITFFDYLGLHVKPSFVDINLSTLFGAVIALFWNYNGYRWFVFKEQITPLE